MRDDMPEPIRLHLTHQRKDFIRWVGTQYEELLSAGIDPAPWMDAVVQSLHDLWSEHEDQQAA